MAFAFDAATAGANGITSVTYPHTCTGSNGLLVVNVLEATATVPTVTYNGVALTISDNTGFITSIGYNYLFYLVAPSTGANNVIVTVAGGHPYSVSASYTGFVVVDPGASAHSNTNGIGVTAQASNVTTTVDNDWVIGIFNFSGASITAGSGTTQRTQYNQGLTIMDSNANITPAGATSLNITCASQNIGAVAFCVQSQAAPILDGNEGIFQRRVNLIPSVSHLYDVKSY